MAGMYHINGEGVTPCKATKGHCPFGQGEENNHFADAGEAMAVFEYRLAKEYDGGLGSVSKAAPCPVCGKVSPCGENDHMFAPASSSTEPEEETAALTEPKLAADLVAEGADPKAVRDALRAEHPDWTNQQVHVVSKAMITNADPKKAAAAAPTAPASARNVAALFRDYNEAHKLKAKAEADRATVQSDIKAHDQAYGAAEGRAHHYDYRSGPGKSEGVNPHGGSTFFQQTLEQKIALDAAHAQVTAAIMACKNTQTAVEEAGAGHRIPDDGNTVRVRTQAQKWLLENELQGQISDGQWENTQPENHWQDWSNAKVIVDPKNPGRNFRPIKDNYQLNASSLLEVVGDRMVDDVKANTGKDYDEKAMAKDLTDLRKIFKTHRGAV